MSYDDFKKYNNDSKKHFSSLGRISNVDNVKGTCTLTFEDRVTHNLSIQNIVDDIAYNGMGAVSNPSALRKWKGFS